jgi:acyl-CoA thioester hydrolase
VTDTTGAAAREWLMQREPFATWCRVSVRYNDLDPLGHVNNTAMAIFLEEARCGLITPRLKAHGRHLDIVLASTAMDYRREIAYPGEVEVGTLVTRLGTKSFSLAHGVFQVGQCVGTAELIMVVFDLDKRTSAAPPADVRAFLTSLQRS